MLKITYIILSGITTGTGMALLFLIGLDLLNFIDTGTYITQMLGVFCLLVAIQFATKILDTLLVGEPDA